MKQAGQDRPPLIHGNALSRGLKTSPGAHPTLKGMETRGPGEQTVKVQCPWKSWFDEDQLEIMVSLTRTMSTLQGTKESLTPHKRYEMGTYSHPERQSHSECGIAYKLRGSWQRRLRSSPSRGKPDTWRRESGESDDQKRRCA